MDLMENETVLLELKKQLTLTTHRLRYQRLERGDAEITSIMLDQLASVVLIQTSHIVLLLAAMLTFLAGLFVSVSEANRLEALIIGAVCSVILVIFFFFTRRQVLSFASTAGTTITLETRGMRLDAIKEFIDQTEAAKNARYFARVDS